MTATTYYMLSVSTIGSVYLLILSIYALFGSESLHLKDQDKFVVGIKLVVSSIVRLI